MSSPICSRPRSCALVGRLFHGVEQSHAPEGSGPQPRALEYRGRLRRLDPPGGSVGAQPSGFNWSLRSAWWRWWISRGLQPLGRNPLALSRTYPEHRSMRLMKRFRLRSRLWRLNPTSNPRVLTIVAAIFLASLLLKPLLTMGQERDVLVEAPRGFLNRPSLEQHKLRFELGGTVLGVPRNYLIEWWPTRMTQAPPSFMAMASFPDFRGATRSTMNCYDVLGVADVRNCDVVLFIASSSARPVTVPGQPYWFYGSDKSPPELADYGLLRNPKLPHSYVWIGPDSHSTGSVSCSNQLHACRMALIASDIRWEAEFPRRLLPQWRAVRDGLTDLIGSFAKSTETGGGVSP